MSGPRLKCSLLLPSREAAVDFVALADQVYSQYPDKRDSLFFVQCDFDANQEVFQKVRCPIHIMLAGLNTIQLKLQSAPVLFHVMEKGNPKKCAQYETFTL